MDSPRGRIYLMRAGTDGRVGIGDAFVEHFDTCLGCMACETACPSGVRYAPLIEETRAVVEHHHRRPIGERLFRQLLFLVLPLPRGAFTFYTGHCRRSRLTVRTSSCATRLR